MRNVVVKINYSHFQIRVPIFDAVGSDRDLKNIALDTIERELEEVSISDITPINYEVSDWLES